MAIRGKILVVALLVLALAAITPAFAGEKEKLGDAWWTGPLETSNPNVIPKNHLYIETYFIVEQDNGVYNFKGKQSRTPYDNAYQSVTLFAYGITNKFNLQFLPVFYGVQGLEKGSGSTAGMNVGNMTVRTPYQFYSYKQGKIWPSFTISPGFIAPIATGSTNATNPWTPWFGLWFQRPFWMPGGRILRVRANQNFYFPIQDGKTTSLAACPVAQTTLLADGGTCSLSGGKYGKTYIGMEYSLTKHWVPAWDFVWKYTGQVTAKAANGANLGPTATASSCNLAGGCQWMVIDPALEYNFTGNVGIIFGVELTVAGRNTGSYIAPQIALQIFK
jgi:hypothetical protein